MVVEVVVVLVIAGRRFLAALPIGRCQSGAANLAARRARTKVLPRVRRFAPDTAADTSAPRGPIFGSIFRGLSSQTLQDAVSVRSSPIVSLGSGRSIETHGWKRWRLGCAAGRVGGEEFCRKRKRFPFRQKCLDRGDPVGLLMTMSSIVAPRACESGDPVVPNGLRDKPCCTSHARESGDLCLCVRSPILGP
jgi:hypothetical protein